MKLFRIGLRQFPLFDGTGAFLYGGRWNSPGKRAIYCAENLSCARLETLVYVGLVAPPLNHVFIEITVPEDVEITHLKPADLPQGWDNLKDKTIAQEIGDQWFFEARTAVLFVPSVASRGEQVVVLNQSHPDFHRITASSPEPLIWDERLFKEP